MITLPLWLSVIVFMFAGWGAADVLSRLFRGDLW